MWKLSYDAESLRSPATAALVAAVVFALIMKVLGMLTESAVTWASLLKPSLAAGAACGLVMHLGRSAVDRTMLTDTFD